MPDFASVTIVTPSLGLLLTTCVLMAAPAKEEDPAARAQATLQRVSKLPLEHQRIWLRLIEQRYGWAVLLTLKPEDAQREQARVAKILRQKTVGWDELVTLLRQLDQREKAAIARLVRQYRSEVYGTFHKRPRDLIDRQDSWYRIWTLWEKSGSPPEQQDRLMDWLADAIKASAKDSFGPLPPDPTFGEDVELVPERLVKQFTQPPVAKPDETKPATAGPRAAEVLPGPELQARSPLPPRVPDPRRAIGPAKRPSEAVVVRHDEDLLWLPSLAKAPPAVVPPFCILPAIVTGDPKELTTLPRSPHQALVMAVQRGALATPESFPDAVAKTESRGAKPQAIGPQRQPSEPPLPRSVEPRPPDQPIAGPAPATAGPRAISQPESVAIEPENPHASHQDVVARLPHKLTEFAVPPPERLAEYRVERKPVRPTVAAGQPQSPSSTAAQADEHAQVNVDELRTRIEGINLSLRNLETELNEKRDFTADQLDSLISRLDILMLRQKDLTLFRDLTTPREQAKVGQIDSSRSVVATMGTRIAELRTRIRENEAVPEAERTAALKHLDELSDRLATMTAEK
ncbi:MAG: hypothetical protein ABSG53_21025 [Thermoguttaceae bacterium]